MWLLLLTSLSLVQGFSPQYIDGQDSAYTCNCMLKEEYQPSTTSTTTTTSTATPLVETAIPRDDTDLDRLPTRFWSLYNGHLRRAQHTDLLTSTFLDRVLSVFRRRLILTTPIPPLQPMNDAAGTALRGLGKTIFTKYFERLRKEWNVLDRFTCKCQGELLDVLKARNYLSLTILHD